MPDSADYQARLQLRHRLLALPGPQLDSLIYTLQPPAGNVPPVSSANAARVTALLEWVESPIGCGLAALRQVLTAVEGDSGAIAHEDTPPTPLPPSASGDTAEGKTTAPSTPDRPINPPSTDENPTYDVFISYSTQDKHWVRGELLPTLEAAGLRVGIDFRDFRPGAPTITEIERLAETSERTLLVLTPAYVASEWTEFETLLLQTFDPVNKDLRLIPLRKAPCEIPKRLKIFTYVDFADPDDLEFTWRRLLTALGKPPQAEPADLPDTPIQWLLAHPYGMPPNFTGRQTELGMLNDWLNGANTPPLFVLRALGGFGKSALTWHWLTEKVSSQQWPQVVWWSFYETSASFENFLRVTLAYVTGQEPDNVPPREQLNQLLTLLQNRRVLLVMDGFERELRAYSGMGAAYQGDEVEESPATPMDRGGSTITAGEQSGNAGRDCISPLAEDFLRRVASLPNLQGKVLMSTRLRPRAVEVTGELLLQGCQESELTQMEPEDAVAFFQKQGIRGGRAEIEQICGAYGYHPLSLQLLAGYILNDFEQPGDVKAAARLNLTGDLVQRRNHVLARSYENLSAPVRKLLGQIACFRSPVQIVVLEQVGGTEDGAERSPQPSLKSGAQPLRQQLRDLVNRGLLQFDRGTQRFDLHPIVRRYAYDHMTAPNRTVAHSQLRDYFAAVPEPERVQTLEDLETVIELYHHQVRAGQYDEAMALYYERLWQKIYYQLGAYQVEIELLQSLFPHGEDQLPQLQSKQDQGWTLNALANSYSLNGQPTKAISLFEQVAASDEQQEDKKNLAIALENLASMAQLPIGALQAAEGNLHRAILLCQRIEDEFWEAVGYRELGRLLAYQGAWAEAAAELNNALELFEQQGKIQSQGIVWAHSALTALLQVRAGESSAASTAFTAAARALEVADETARTQFPYERDYVRAHWLLGAAHRVNGHLPQSDTHLSDALTRCRTINMVDYEASILLALAQLRADQNQSDEALLLAQDALVITERSGYRLQGADVQLFLAQQALTQGDKSQAIEQGRLARQLARCDGGEYTYKVAYDEAGALLQSLGQPPTE